MKVKPPEKALFPPGAAGEERSPELAVCGSEGRKPAKGMKETRAYRTPVLCGSRML